MPGADVALDVGCRAGAARLLRRYAQEFRLALVCARRAFSGDGGQRLSRQLRERLGDRGTGRGGGGRGGGNLSCRDAGAGRTHSRQWRARARCLGDRKNGGAGAGARLRGGRSHPLEPGLLPAGYRASGRGAGNSLAHRCGLAAVMSDLADLFPGFASRWIDTAAGRIFARTGGEGPALLLLHGHPQTNVMWHRVAPALARHFRLIIPDLPGYGWSDAPDSDAEHAPYTKRAMANAMV